LVLLSSVCRAQEEIIPDTTANAASNNTGKSSLIWGKAELDSILGLSDSISDCTTPMECRVGENKLKRVTIAIGLILIGAVAGWWLARRKSKQ